MRQTIRFFLPACLVAVFTAMALTPKPASAGLAWMDNDGGAVLSAQGINAPLVNGTTPPISMGVEVNFYNLEVEDVLKVAVSFGDYLNDNSPTGPEDTPPNVAGMQFKLDLSAFTGKPLKIQITPSAALNLPDGFPILASYNGGEVNLTTGPFTPPPNLFITFGPDFNQDPLTFPASILATNFLDLVFTINDGVNSDDLLGEDLTIRISEMELVVSDEFGNLIPVESLQEGALQIGIPGDVNRDGGFDIRDPVVLVGRDLGKILPDLPIVKNLPGLSPVLPDGQNSEFAIDGTTDSKILDANKDEFIDVSDVIAIIRKILGINQTPVKAIASGPAVIDIGALVTMDNGQLAVPVYLDAAGIMAATDLTFSFDPAKVKVGAPVLPEGSGHLAYDFNLTENGTLRAIIYSLDNSKGLATGNNPMLLIPVTVLNETDAQVTLTHVTLSNNQAQTYPAELGHTTQAVNKSAQVPTSFALLNNRPNPFNPSTSIAYEVPQQAHITLTIYNVLGQEVIRLVDQVQAAGRYEVNWNAVNTQGARVASGIYMYNISSSTGFSETKRMTLLK